MALAGWDGSNAYIDASEISCDKSPINGLHYSLVEFDFDGRVIIPAPRRCKYCGGVVEAVGSRWAVRTYRIREEDDILDLV